MWSLRKTGGDGVSERNRGGRSDEEVETHALVAVQRALGPLSPESRTRVLRWFAQSDATNGEVAQVPVSQSTFQDLAALFEAVRPKSDVDRALAACYFRNEVLKEPEVGASTLVGDLRQIGHSLGNISSTLHGLNVRTPSLVMITSKNKIGRKRYRITSAGVKQVGEMVARKKREA